MTLVCEHCAKTNLTFGEVTIEGGAVQNVHNLVVGEHHLAVVVAADMNVGDLHLLVLQRLQQLETQALATGRLQADGARFYDQQQKRLYNVSLWPNNSGTHLPKEP